MDLTVLADRLLSNWFLHRLGVPNEETEVFFRLVETGTGLQSRIDLLQTLGDSATHKEATTRLRQNQMNSGIDWLMVSSFQDPTPTAAFPRSGIIGIWKGRPEEASGPGESPPLRSILTSGNC